MQGYAGVPSRENERYWLAVESDKDVGPGTVHAPGRRLSESRMMANLTYGSMWEGMGNQDMSQAPSPDPASGRAACIRLRRHAAR